jgi:hypothetical protein
MKSKVLEGRGARTVREWSPLEPGGGEDAAQDWLDLAGEGGDLAAAH